MNNNIRTEINHYIFNVGKELYSLYPNPQERKAEILRKLLLRFPQITERDYQWAERETEKKVNWKKTKERALNYANMDRAENATRKLEEAYQELDKPTYDNLVKATGCSKSTIARFLKWYTLKKQYRLNKNSTGLVQAKVQAKPETVQAKYRLSTGSTHPYSSSTSSNSFSIVTNTNDVSSVYHDPTRPTKEKLLEGIDKIPFWSEKTKAEMRQKLLEEQRA